MIISISGGSGAGKSYLAQLLKNNLDTLLNRKVALINMDDYYKTKPPIRNYDHPDAFDINALLITLRHWHYSGTLLRQKYSFINHKTSRLPCIKDIKIIIIEGLYSYYDKQMYDLSDLRVYVQADEQLRIKRRIQRDLKDRGIPEDENRSMIQSFVLNMHKRYVRTQKEKSDIIVSSDNINSLVNRVLRLRGKNENFNCR